MSFFSKLFDYNKFGPGVSKEQSESGLKRFFRILKSKFWKICALNLIFVACLIPIIAMSVGIYHLTPLSEDNIVEENLYSHNISADFINIVNKYISTYKPDDKALIELNASINKLIEKIESVNPDLLTYGTAEFDSSKYTEEISNEIRALTEKTLAVIDPDRFKIEFSDGAWNIIDVKSDNYVLTSIEADGNNLSVTDRIPSSYLNYFYWILTLLPFALIGPAAAGVVKVTRDFVREEPVFLLSDFADAAKKNFFPALFISFVQYVLAAIVINAVSLYYSYLGNGFVYTLGFAASLFLAFIYLAMHLYIMLMQVTLKLNLKKIYKNAFFLSIICLFRNILLIVGMAAVLFLVWLLFYIGQAYSLVLGFLFLIVLTFLIAFMFYVVVSAVYPPIKRIIIDPYYAEHTEETSDSLLKKKDDNGEISDNKNDSDETAGDESEQSEYVYHNGRMIHRSALENDTLFRD